MNSPSQLTKDQLVLVVEEIRDTLYLDEAEAETIKRRHGVRVLRKIEKGASRNLPHEMMGDLFEYLNPDKEWVFEDLERIADTLRRARLRPNKATTVDEAYRPRTSAEIWKDDSVQFPRLLTALSALGIDEFLTNKGWKDLEMLMNLPRRKIWEIFDRATKADLEEVAACLLPCPRENSGDIRPGGKGVGPT